MTGTAIISARGLTMGFGGQTLMEGLDFDIHPGEIFVILGGSGCGRRIGSGYVTCIGVSFPRL